MNNSNTEIKRRLYGIWIGILRRCYNEEDSNYYNYGGRGIDVDEEWIYDFSSFYQWAIQNHYHIGDQCDRIDNDSGYFPWNCRFVSSKINNNNRRNTVFITVKGETNPLSFWVDILKIPHSTIYRWYSNYGEEYVEAKLLDIINSGGWNKYQSLTNQTRNNMQHMKSWYQTHQKVLSKNYTPVTNVSIHRYRSLTINETCHSISDWSRIINIPANRIHQWIDIYGEEKAKNMIQSYFDKSILKNNAFIEINNHILHYTQWAKTCNIPSTMIKLWLKENGMNYTKERILSYLNHEYASTEKRKNLIFCVTNQKYYASYSEIENDLQFPKGTISKYFGKNKYVIYGYIFQFID